MYEDKLGKVMSGVETAPADLEQGASGDDRVAHQVLVNEFNE